MDFKVLNQKEVRENPPLVSFMLDTMVENLSYVYGDDMGSDENRRMWTEYNLERHDAAWHTVFGSKDGRPLGFIVYKIENKVLYVCDFEIKKEARYSPALLRGMLRAMISTEKENFDVIRGYINRKNEISQRNFLRHATQISETEKGFSFVIDKTAAQRIKERI